VLRAREQGVPSYVKFREFCGLPRAFKFSDLSDVMNQESIDKLAQVYEYKTRFSYFLINLI